LICPVSVLVEPARLEAERGFLVTKWYHSARLALADGTFTEANDLKLTLGQMEGLCETVRGLR